MRTIRRRLGRAAPGAARPAPASSCPNGFISALSPDGQVTNLKWIEGGEDKVKLDAPTGSAIVKGVLYVADLATTGASSCPTSWRTRSTPTS
ncbi:hypothetical protein ACMHYB_01730 [Sorangium sp. So ce1128]